MPRCGYIDIRIKKITAFDFNFFCIYIYVPYIEQGIYEIEDGFFFEDEQHTKLFARVAEIFRLRNVLVVLGSYATIFRERGRMHVCV